MLCDKLYVHMNQQVLVCPDSLAQIVLEAFYRKIIVSMPMYFQQFRSFVGIAPKFENKRSIAAEDDCVSNSCFQSLY